MVLAMSWSNSSSSRRAAVFFFTLSTVCGDGGPADRSQGVRHLSWGFSHVGFSCMQGRRLLSNARVTRCCLLFLSSEKHPVSASACASACACSRAPTSASLNNICLPPCRSVCRSAHLSLSLSLPGCLCLAILRVSLPLEYVSRSLSLLLLHYLPYVSVCKKKQTNAVTKVSREEGETLDAAIVYWG